MRRRAKGSRLLAGGVFTDIRIKSDHSAHRRWRVAALTLAAATLLSSAFSASATVGVNKSFTPNSVVAGQPSTLTILFLNPNATAAINTAVTDTLPAGVKVASPPAITNTCGLVSDVTAVAGSGSVSIANGTIPASAAGVAGQCQFTVNVVSSTVNTYLNDIPSGAVSSSQSSNLQATQATLVVSTPAAITGSKAFLPTNVHGGGAVSTLTITLTNPNPVALTNAAITDTLPATITIAGTPNAATTCGAGTATASSAATNPATIKLAAGTIPANGSCTIKVDVVARNPNAFVNGNQTNTIAAGALTTAEGVTSPAIAANINVQTGAQVTKAFAPTPIAPSGPSTLTITVANFNATVLTPVTFTDTWAATMSLTGAPSTTCGGTLTNTATSVTLTGGSVAAAPVGAGSTTCTITVPVTATASTANTIPAGNFNGVAFAAATGTLSVSAITGSKAFTTPAVQGGSTTMTITLNNLTSTAATITSFSDLLTSMGTGFTVSGAPIVGPGDCGSTITAPVGGTSITATAGTIPANGSCTMTIPIAIAANASTGTRTNNIVANAVKTNVGNNTVAIAGSVAVTAALTVSKAFSPATVQAGAVSRLTVTLTHANGAPALSSIAFTDDLTTMGAGFVVAPTPNAVTTCTSGTVSAVAGATNFAFSAGSLAAGANSCTVAVNIATPATTTPASVNTIAANTITTSPQVTNAAATATLTRIVSSVTVNKSFTPTIVAINGISTLAIQIRNNNASATNLTGVALTDFFPSGMVVAPAPTTSFTGTGCSGAIITAPAGATSIAMTGASVNANAICTLSVKVVPNVAGNLIDTIPAGAVTSAQGVSNPLQGTATLASIGKINLTVTKTDGVTSVIPGNTTTYTIAVGNTGPDPVTGLLVNDPPPAGLTFTSWTCVGASGGTCTASGSGAIADTVTIPKNGTVTYSVIAAVASSATGSIINTVSLGVPGAVINTGATSATDTDTLTPTVDSADHEDGQRGECGGGDGDDVHDRGNERRAEQCGGSADSGYVAGGDHQRDVYGGGFGGASGFTASGSGNINDTANLPAGSTITYTVVGNVSAAATGTLSNTATVTAPAGVTDSNPANNSATDTDTLAFMADLAITKTDNVASVSPGTATTYVITVTNNGPSNVVGAKVADVLPATISSATYTAVGGGGASGFTASGSGNINDLSVNIPRNGTVTYTVVANISAAATGSLSNTATVTAPAGVTDPTPTNNSATDTDTLTPQVSLAVTKDDGSSTYAPGGTATYTIKVTNSGPSNAANVTLTDSLPGGVTLSANATCTPTGTANCGAVTGTTGGASMGTTGASIAAGAANALTFTVPVSIASSLVTDPLVNTATATDTVTGATASGSDSDTRAAQVTLAVVKSDGSASYTPGGTATYTITVTDTGSSDAENVSVTDTFPAGLTLTAGVTCVANGAAACGTVVGAIGQTGFSATGAQVGAGSGDSLVYMVPVAFAAGMVANPLINTVTATDVATGATISGTDSDTLAAQVSLAVTKTDGSTTYTPGGTATYTVTVTDGGLSDASNVSVSDTLPAGVTLTGTVTCAVNGTANCGTVTGTTGQTSFGATSAHVGAGSGNSLVFTVPVAFGAGMTTDPLINTASANDALSGASGAGSDSDDRAPDVSLSVTKTDNSATYTPGGVATYVITITDTGVSNALDLSVADVLPPGVSLTGNVVCVVNGSANCGTVTGITGATSFHATGASIAEGNGNSLVFTAPVAFAASLAADPLVNAATVTDLASGASGSGSDSDTRAATAVLGVTKSDSSTTYTPGGTATYTIKVTNAGPSDALALTVNDPLPAGVTLNGTATCVPAGVAVCGTVTGIAGQTSFGTTGAQISAGATNFLTFTAPVAFDPAMTANPLVNTVTVTDPASALGASVSDSDTLVAAVDLAITKTDNVSSVVAGTATTYTIVVTNARAEQCGGSADSGYVAGGDHQRDVYGGGFGGSERLYGERVGEHQRYGESSCRIDDHLYGGRQCECGGDGDAVEHGDGDGAGGGD